jgi:hypothetical protein
MRAGVRERAEAPVLPDEQHVGVALLCAMHRIVRDVVGRGDRRELFRLLDRSVCHAETLAVYEIAAEIR